MNKHLFSSFLILVIFMTYSCKTKQQADCILFNAKIYTVKESFDLASAIAIKDGKFIAVGSDKNILDNFSADMQIDAAGKPVYPGFNDGHSHFIGLGIDQLRSADLVGCSSFEEVVERVSIHQKKQPNEWILGRGWDQNDWLNKDYPTKDTLDILFPDQPVVLTRIDGHAVLANSEALRRASITTKTKVDGGEIILLNGEPTGILVDNAIELVTTIIPKPGNEEKIRALKLAEEQCFAVGLTTVTDAGLDLNTILLIDSLQKQNQLEIRIYAMIDPTIENINYFFERGPLHTGSLTVSSVKLYIDGALGSRGALLLQPYSDDPENIGLQLHPQEYFDQICEKANLAGFQVNTHAIGDSGNRIMLRTYAKYLKEKNDKRWRVEHAQIVEPSDLHFFADFSVIPSVQATHCTSDMYWAIDRLGKERLTTAYAYNDLLIQSGWLINGTDFPIEDISPLKTFYAAVVRKDLKGWPENGFQIENALSRENALKSITIWPAKGSFDENHRGSIEAGKAADFVILEKDIMEIPENEIPFVKVSSTFLNGKVVYNSK